MQNDLDADTSDSVAVIEITNGSDIVAPGNSIAGTQGGLFVLNADGGYSFDPNGDFIDLAVGESRTTAVTYEVEDSHGGTDTAVLTMTVTGVNNSPVATANTGTVNEDTSISQTAATGVLANDTDPDTTDVLSVSQITNGSDTVAAGTGIAGSQGGLFVIQSDGSYTFSSNNDFDYLALGEAENTFVEYEVTDGQGGSSVQRLEMTVTGVNDVPVGQADNVTTSENIGLQVGSSQGVLVNDSDADASNTLAVTSISNGTASVLAGETIQGTQGGVFTVLADGGYSFNPQSDFLDLSPGEQRITQVTYSMSDGIDEAQAVLSVNVTGINTAPTQNGTVPTQNYQDFDVVQFDTSPYFSDIDTSNQFTYSVDELPAGLTLNTSSGVITGQLESNASVNGPYSFVVTAHDSAGVQVNQTVLFSVANTVPVVVDDENRTLEETVTPITGHLVSGLTGDTDSDQDQLFVLAVNTIGIGSNGSVVVATQYGEIDVDESGQYSYQVNNTLAAVQSLAVGEVLVDEISYSITDQQGGEAQGYLRVTIQGENDAPEALADSYTTDEQTELLVSASNGVLANDIDRDLSDEHQVVTIVQGEGQVAVGSSLRGSQGGVFTLEEDGQFRFEPGDDFIDLGVNEARTTQVTYQMTDQHGATSLATLTVEVTGINDAPEAREGYLAPIEDSQQIDVSIEGFFGEIDGTDELTYSVENLPEGLVLNESTGIITGQVVSSASVAGPYELVLTATDKSGATNTQTYTWTVINPVPIAFNNTDTVTEERVLSSQGNLLTDTSSSGLDYDPDGDTLVLVGVYNNENGSPTAQVESDYGVLSVASNGEYQYELKNSATQVQALAQDEVVNDRFFYQIIDADGAVATAQFIVTIQGQNEPLIDSNEPVLEESVAAEDPAETPARQGRRALAPVAGDAGESASDTSTSADSNDTSASATTQQQVQRNVEVLTQFSENTALNPELLSPVSLSLALEDQVLDFGIVEQFTLPPNAFEHTNPSEVITLEVRLSDGSQLPDYIKFDESNMSFEVDGRGASLSGQDSIVIRVIAKDSQGNSATSTFTIAFKETQDQNDGDESQDVIESEDDNNTNESTAPVDDVDDSDANEAANSESAADSYAKRKESLMDLMKKLIS